MKVKLLDDYDKNQIVSSYVISDIYNLIWILIRYAVVRDAKNIRLKVCVEKGAFELYDDGDALNLTEMENESLLLKNIKNICEYSIRTRSQLGLFSEHLDNNGKITKVEADRVYRNVFIVKDLFKSVKVVNQSLRCKIAFDCLKRFEKILKIVVIENVTIDWSYECEDSKTRFAIKMVKTRAGRFNSLFKGKYQIIFETGLKGIETLATCANYKENPVVLYRGLPNESTSTKTFDSLKNVVYVNYNDVDEVVSKSSNLKQATMVRDQRTRVPKTRIRGTIEARADRFKGTRECLESFKAASSAINVPGQPREFLKDLILIGQFDKKAILAKRTTLEFEEIWMFDQHACAERINLELLMKANGNLSRSEMNMKACKSAVKFGDELDIFQQETILKELENCQEPFHCAHGRPTCCTRGSHEEEPETREKEVKEDKSIKRPNVKPFKEDPSFGKRLNFTVNEEKNKNEIKEPVETKNIMAADLVKRKQVEYNKKLRKNPHDVNLWLEFVAFQDRIGSWKQRKLIERKISILKKAIEFNCENLNLILLHLSFAAEIEDSSTLMRLWEKYLKAKLSEEDSFTLSEEYLNFRQKRFLAFSFDQVNEAFSDVFKQIKEDGNVNLLIQLYLNYFWFLKRAGFTERIVALYQALIEVNIEKYNYGQVDLEAYEDQWDFGLMEHIGDDCLVFDSPLYPEKFNENASSKLAKWIQLEKYRDLTFWHPKHCEDSFDLEGQVIFDDLKDFIKIIDNRDDILLFIKIISLEMNNLFTITPIGFLQWYIQVIKRLLPFYKNDWEFILNLFQTIHRFNPEEAESFSKSLLSENRDSLDLFFAYGQYQEFKGNSQMATKIYDSLRKRTLKYDNIEHKTKALKTRVSNIKEFEFEKENLKLQVYELVRCNPGDKELYMRIIEGIEPLDCDLAMEIFNLLDEQQLRLKSLLEEV